MHSPCPLQNTRVPFPKSSTWQNEAQLTPKNPLSQKQVPLSGLQNPFPLQFPGHEFAQPAPQKPSGQLFEKRKQSRPDSLHPLPQK